MILRLCVGGDMIKNKDLELFLIAGHFLISMSLLFLITIELLSRSRFWGSRKNFLATINIRLFLSSRQHFSIFRAIFDHILHLNADSLFSPIEGSLFKNQDQYFRFDHFLSFLAPPKFFALTFQKIKKSLSLPINQNKIYTPLTKILSNPSVTIYIKGYRVKVVV